MKLIFHGGAMEVGRSCVELQTQQGRFLLDCGIKLGLETEYPEVPKNLKGIDATLITHSHLDHCGALPYFLSKGLKCPIFMTLATKENSKILIKDNFKVESIKGIPPYKKEHLTNVFDYFKTKEHNQFFEIKDTYFEFIDAGHIPGSSMILIEAEEKRIIYTGDINLSETRLMKGQDLNDLKGIDTIIMENTYGDRNHPNRTETEKKFLEMIKETIARGGQAFIPVFAEGRAQEILLLLDTIKWNVPIYLDGMAKQITELIVSESSCKDVKKLESAKNKVIALEGRLDREKALKVKGIFVTTSGMLAGGPILEYLKTACTEPKNSILLTGYVSEGTNGRLLLEEGAMFFEGMRIKVKAEYAQFDFSAHSGLDQLNEMIDKIKPKRLILMHGDPEALQKFADEQRKKGREVFVPKIGSEINI